LLSSEFPDPTFRGRKQILSKRIRRWRVLPIEQTNSR
jgi:hypothetical protein